MKKHFSKNLNRQFHSVNRRGTPLLSLLVLAACGGGRDTSSGEAGSSPVTTSYQGAVIKGPLEDALVFLDYDGDGALSAGEPSVRTADDGSFSISGTVSGLGFIAQTDENTVDTSSGEVLDNVVLKAPSGSSVVSPTTTIVGSMVTFLVRK